MTHGGQEFNFQKGKPVKILYRPLKAVVAGIPVIMGPETEILVDDEGWWKILKQLEQDGFDDPVWKAGAGTHRRVHPLTDDVGSIDEET